MLSVTQRKKTVQIKDPSCTSSDWDRSRSKISSDHSRSKSSFDRSRIKTSFDHRASYNETSYLRKASYSHVPLIEISQRKNSKLTHSIKNPIVYPTALPYVECLDVAKFRSKLETIKSGVWGDHVLKAYEMIEQLKEDTDQKSKSLGRRKPSSKNLTESLVASEFSTELWKPRKLASAKQKVSSTMLMNRLCLPKEDIFTGTEAKALKNLLRTLRWKVWNPELYFHIRFFSLRNKLYPMSEETKALVKSRWLYIWKMLKTMAKIKSVLAIRSYEKTLDCVTYIDMVQKCISPVYWGNDPTLVFNKNAYKVHSNVTVCIDTQQILIEVSPEDRTSEDINQVVLNLQYVKDFARIPVALQHKLAKVAYYIWIGSNRVILRQGHVAQNYYFVLMGQALSKRYRDDGKTETTAVLRRGDGFGSVAIFNKCPRLVTVISQTPVDLLVIPKDAIKEHFGKNLKDLSLDVIHFLSKMWFMHTWPLEHLVQCPHQAKRKQFRRTDTIEVDGAKSEWIYVIIRGTFRVYQRLPIATKERSRKKSLNLDSVDTLASSRERDRHRLWGQSPQGLQTFKEADGQILNHLPSYETGFKKPKSWLENFEYKLVDNLRHLDVFGLEDICLDPKNPPPERHLLLISDDVECVMMSKNFYLQMASPQLRKKVYARLTARKLTYTQVTSQDCLLIPLGGIYKSPDLILDPMDPMLCIHC